MVALVEKKKKEEVKARRVFGGGQSKRFAAIDRKRRNTVYKDLYTAEQIAFAESIAAQAEELLFNSKVYDVGFNLNFMTVKIEYSNKDKISMAGITWEKFAQKLVRENELVVYGQERGAGNFLLNIYTDASLIPATAKKREERKENELPGLFD